MLRTGFCSPRTVRVADGTEHYAGPKDSLANWMAKVLIWVSLAAVGNNFVRYT
jgi:hypothetical protein